MNDIINIMSKNQGYVSLKELKAMRVHTRQISKAIDDGIISRIKPGLYKLIDYPWDETSGFVDIAKANSNSVICLASASEYHGLTTNTPAIIYVAIPHNSVKSKIQYPPVKEYYFTEKAYRTGITEIETNSGRFKIYDMEKTIVDLFRYRKKTGEDIFLESIRNYLNGSKRDINKLIEYATILKQVKKITPYIKAILS